MPNYVTLQEIKDLGIMPEEDIDEIETKYPGISLKIANAVGGYVDTYCAKRHIVPWNILKVPEAVKYNIVQTVVYKLYLKRGFNPSSQQDELIKNLHDESFLWLKEVAKGEVELPNDADQTPEVDEFGVLGDSGTGSAYDILSSDYDSNDCGCGKAYY